MAEALRERHRKWRRGRALASDRRTGVYATYSVRRAQYDYARRSWKALIGVAAIFGALAPSALLLPIRPRFFALGLWSASAGWLVYGFVLVGSGTALRTMGGVAEDWTASELRPLRKSGWRLINHVMVGAVDVDHVVIGPGGIVAVETKWTASEVNPSSVARHWTFGAGIEQIAENARRLTNTLRNASGGTTVRAVVAVWGPELVPEQWEHVTVDGVVVIHGLALRRYVAELNGEIGPETADAVWSRLEADVRHRDEKHPTPEPPPTPIDLLLRATSVVGAALAALASIGFIWRRNTDIVPLIAAPVAAGLLGVGARLWKPLRWVAIGWLTGVSIAAVLLVVGLTSAALR